MRVLGRSALQSVRAAVIAATLGIALVLLLCRAAERPNSPLDAARRAAGLPAGACPAVGIALVLALAVVGGMRAVTSAPRISADRRGLAVRDHYGEYRIDWENLEEVAAVGDHAIGLRVRSRDDVLRTHRGTERQRLWLETREPRGDWDYLMPRSDLGLGPEHALAAIEAVRRAHDRSDSPRDATR